MAERLRQPGWFGPESWGAPVNKALPRLEIPIGEECLYCEERIGPADSGEMTWVIGGPTPDLRPIHLECQMRMVIGSVGHLQQQCSCYGGTAEDPPGMTKRQGALAAWDLFRAQTGAGVVHANGSS